MENLLWIRSVHRYSYLQILTNVFRHDYISVILSTIKIYNLLSNRKLELIVIKFINKKTFSFHKSPANDFFL